MATTKPLKSKKLRIAGKRPVKNRNPKQSKKIGQVWIEKRGTTQGKNIFHVFVRTASKQNVDMYDSPDEKRAKWEAKALRQKLANNSYDVAWIKKTNPTRRKNLDHRDSDHPIEVTKHFRSGPPGYLTPWQRAHHAGQADLFAHGIKPAKFRQRNPDLEQQAIEDRKEFAGHYDGPKNVYTPAGTPQGISRLGQLAELHLVGGAKLFFLHDKAEYILAQDTNHKLHVASTEPGAMVDNEPGDYGEIKRVEYLEQKTHLAEGNELIQWVHKMGEITGKRPSLRVDKNRQLRIVGGDYSINWRGIIN